MTATDATELRQAEPQRTGAESAMHDQDNGSRAGSDEVLKALDELEAVLRQNAESERLLAKRIAEVRLARQNGREWKADPRRRGRARDRAAGEHDPAPAVRGQRLPAPVLVVALRAEGQSIPSIAHLFGVTHQRVSNLLRRVAQGNAAAASNGSDEHDRLATSD